MAITINDFLKRYNLVDEQLSSYDNDTIRTITKVVNGKMDDYVDSENDNAAKSKFQDTILLYIGLYHEYIKNDADMAKEYYLIPTNNSHAMCNLGKLYEKQGKFELAEKYYVMSNNPIALYSLAILYKNQHKLDLAEKYFLLAIYENDPNAMYSLGLLYKNQRKLDLAEKYYLMASQYNHSGAMNNLGLLYKKENKLDLAEEYYLMAIEHNSKTALYNLGLFYEEHHKFNLATKYYLKAVLVDADTIKDIVRIIPSLSQELQLDILESVPRIRTTNEYFHKIPEAVRTIFANKQMEMMRCLISCLIQDVANICVAYY